MSTAPVVDPTKPMPRPESFPPEGFTATHAARATIVDGQLKRATVQSKLSGQEYEIWCDEAPGLGGRGEYAPPAAFAGAAVAFSLLTQVARYGRILEMTITRADARVEFDWFLQGSIPDREVQAGAKACRVVLDIESEDPPEKIEALIRMSHDGAFVEQMVMTPVPMKVTTRVNGVEQDGPTD
jgi:hypothetical protein